MGGSVQRRVWGITVVTNLVYACCYAATSYFGFKVQMPSGAAVFYRIAPAAFAYFWLALWVGWFLTKRWTAHMDGSAGNANAQAMHDEVLALPRRGMWFVAAGWTGLLVWGMPFLLTATPWIFTVRHAIEFGGATAVGATAAAALTYLMLERQLRDLRAAVVRVPRSETRSGILWRGLIAFGAATIVPLVQVSLIVSGAHEADAQLIRQFLFVSAFMVVSVGSAVALFAARTVADPLRSLRAGLAAVEEGDLGTRVPVDSVGEIAEVQSGFNEMVAGLRERERMRGVFARHVGAEVAEHALTTDFTDVGEVRSASALFIDVIGSTGLSERVGAERVVHTLNTFFDRVVHTVAAEGGVVNKFQGDGALCIFGAPLDQPDHAERALRTARCLREAVSEIGDIAAAIGVGSGEVVAGYIGAQDRYEYTIIGDPVNEAARLSDQAKLRPGLVLAAASALAAAGVEAENWTSAGQIQLRGKAAPTDTFEPR